MLLKIAICDDNKEMCNDLENMLRQIEKARGYKFEIKIFISGEALHKYFFEVDIDFDIIFLDIEFPENINGIDIGNIIRNRFFKETVKIVYISSYEKYALDLFKIRPFDFMIKPPSYIKIDEIITSIVKVITKQNKPFEYKVGAEHCRIDLYKVLYFTSQWRKVEIITIDKKPFDSFYQTLSAVGKDLAESDFFFIQKGYLVNYHKCRWF